MRASTSRGSYTFGSSFIGFLLFEYLAKQKVRSVLPVQNRANVKSVVPPVFGLDPLSWVQRHPVPVTEDKPSPPTVSSARSSGTTWAARHGCLHQPHPLFAFADRLLLPVIAGFVWGKYTIFEKKCQEGDGSEPPPPLLMYFQRLLERIQIPCFSALAISSSRNMGWAMEISFSARSHVEQPTRLTPPYSVTM